MKAAVSYNLRFNNEGTSYSQMISLKMTEKELNELNNFVRKDKKNYGDLALYYKGELKEGNNFVTLSYRDSILRYIEENKVKINRKVLDRNTLFRIKLVKPFSM